MLAVPVNNRAPAAVAVKTSSASEAPAVSSVASSSIVTTAGGPTKTWHRHPGVLYIIVILLYIYL